MPLPFLVVHGDGLWKVLLVGLVALALVATLLIRKLVARVLARVATRQLDLDRGEGVIRGTLGGGSIATLAITAINWSNDGVFNHRGGELWIETPDGRIPLVGDIQVISGSRASAARNGVPKRTPPELRTNPSAHRPRLRDRMVATSVLLQLAPGDRVVARGTLVREPSAQATDYRESATTLSLHAPIQIAAVKPRGAGARPSLVALALLSVAVGFIGYKIEEGLGDSWRHDCWNIPHLSTNGPTHVVLSNTNVCVLANAMPDENGMLEELSDRYDRTPITSEADLEQHLALARFSGGCAASLRFVNQRARPELRLAEAELCHDFGSQQGALIELGRFDEAARFGPIERRSGSLFVLGGDWTAAAELADNEARNVRQPDADFDAATRDHVVLRWKCLAELMRWNGGDRAALDRVRALAPGANSACRPELVEMSPPADRTRLLLPDANEDVMRAALEPLGLDEARAFSLQQALGGQPAMHQESIGSTLADGSSELSMMWAPTVWAVAVAPEPPATTTVAFLLPGQGQFAYAAARVVLHVYDGDLVAAHRDADRAIAIASSVDDDHIYARRDLGVLHALIDLYGTSTTTPFTDVPDVRKTDDDELLAFLLPHIYLRHGIKHQLKESWRLDSKALQAAADGDGEQVAAEMTSSYRAWTNMDLLAVLPRIKTHRDEVIQLAKTGPTSESMVGFDFPWSAIAFAAERRTIFEIAGEKPEAARWAAIYARYRKALTDRTTLIALSLWYRL